MLINWKSLDDWRRDSEEYQECRFCRSLMSEIVKRKEPDEMPIIRCTNCGMRYQLEIKEEKHERNMG